MRVFISHSSKDKAAVDALAVGLVERGFDVWLDGWIIRPGDDIVRAINDGLDRADAGLIVFSDHSRESRWVESETSYLTWARIEEGKVLIPLKAQADAWVPPLLRPLAYRRVDEVEAIADALRTRSAGGRSAKEPRRGEHGRSVEVRVLLDRTAAGGVTVSAHIGDEEHARHELADLPAELVRGQDWFLGGFRAGARRSPAAAERVSLEASLAELGRALGSFCLPGGSGGAVAELVRGAALGTTIEVVFESADSRLLGLPFEALHLPDDRPLAIDEKVVFARRAAGIRHQRPAPMAGPLKVLVAVAAPDEGNTTATVLDQERELHNILDAIDEAQGAGNLLQVRLLEVGHPAAMAEALERDAYQVLHVSGHGLPGSLELEDEDGRAEPTTAAELLAALGATGRPLPLVFLNTCHGGVAAGQTASFAEDLLRGGVPAVVAMQTSVSDHYATELARGFYQHLARRELLLPSRALAAARRELEAARQRKLQAGAARLDQVQPEYATATLFLAEVEAPIADFGLDSQPLRARAVHHLAGPVPQLGVDDLIGRRKVLRETLRTLRHERREVAGVVLTGIGGVGKSAVAGRAMRRLVESGYHVAAHVGTWDLQAIAVAVAAALPSADELCELAARLADRERQDDLRLTDLAKALAEQPVVLVLDDFEQNLAGHGAHFADPVVGQHLAHLADNARRGRLLVTCRHPLPGLVSRFRHLAVGPLSPAESRKLLRRLDALSSHRPEDLDSVLRVIGGHPRMLEFLDGLLRGGQGRLSHVTRKLRQTMADAGLAEGTVAADLEEGLQQIILLGARDVLLDELLAICRQEAIEEALQQLAVSHLPVSAPGLAHMLADGPGGDVDACERALRRLEELSLVYRFPDETAWVHRWTAEGLAARSDAESRARRCNRAGRYRWWRVEHESHSMEDAWEAVRNHVAGRDFDAATGVATACFAALERFGQSAARVALASEVLAELPMDHPDRAVLVDVKGRALLALGFTTLAIQLYQELTYAYRQRAEAEPDRADYQRVLSVSYNRMGDLYRALGQGDKARDAYEKDLKIAQRLTRSEPDRADYQHDLSVSYERMGDLYSALGEGDKAHDGYQNALVSAQRAVSAEPDHTNHQRQLSVCYDKMGDLYRALGQGDKARDAYQSSLEIAQRLARAEPDRADYQRDLVVCRVGVAPFSDEPRTVLDRALAILRQLEAEQRLAPVDRPMIAALEKMLQELETQQPGP